MMEIGDIFEYLPHRYPFLLVDRVTALNVGKDIAGYKNVSVNEPFFEGHFPGHPVMPGVLVVEAMAQLAGVLAFKTRGHKPADGYLYYLVGMDRTRFKRPVVPGDRLDMTASITSQRRSFVKFECNAFVDGELACASDILCTERETGS